MKRKKQTENQKAFQKQRKRLLQAVRRAEKQGYIFQDNVVPQMPQRVTKKQLNKITNLKPKDLYKKAEWVDIETGEIFSPTERKEQVKRAGIEKAKETKKRKKEKSKISAPIEKPYYPTISILDIIRERINDLHRVSKPDIPIENRKNELLNILDDSITYYEDNLQEYENYLRQHESEIASLLNLISYDSDGEQISASFVTLGRLLNTQSLSINQAENLSAMSEYYNY